MKIIGIDTGGTFTDFVLWHDGRLDVHKVLSTPDAPERAILQGIEALGLESRDLVVIHGSTVATNAALEGKGVRTLYVTNRGFADLLTIGRQARKRLYDLQPPQPPVPVPPHLCLETGGRITADGSLVEPLTEADLAAMRDAVERLEPEAVAINLLFSYLDDSAERLLEQAIGDAVFVSRSSEVLPVTGEYERGIATWMNAWLGPLVQRYIQRLSSGLPGARVSVMQSSGESVAAEQTSGQAVRLLLSGPAGGLNGAGFVGHEAGLDRLLSFDMGGTSTDVALIDGAPRLTTEGYIADYPIAVPMVDMHTIGAGGGSIARLDAGGALLVGPESAGADPGPACYGRGGEEATVTDANLVLGRLRSDAFLGGRMRLDVDASRRVVGRLGDAMGLSAEEAALGIVRLACEHMARALRVISVQRGIDPRGFTLASFGGAGGLHVCALAGQLGMEHALVPVHAGVLSALGMLVTPPGRSLSRTWLGLLTQRTDAQIEQRLRSLGQQAVDALLREGTDARQLHVEYSLDLRYQGQSYTLNLSWVGAGKTAAAFNQAHMERYGHRMDLEVELVNLRVRVTGDPIAMRLPQSGSPEAGTTTEMVAVAGWPVPVPAMRREAVPAEYGVSGPAVILDEVATIWLEEGWSARKDDIGNLHLRREPG